MTRRRVPESATNSKERRVNNALSARRRPPRLVWSEERERKENEPWVLRFRHYALECRNAGMPEQRRERERRRAENSAAARGKRWHDPRFVCARVWEREKAMVRNGECGAEEREE